LNHNQHKPLSRTIDTELHKKYIVLEFQMEDRPEETAVRTRPDSGVESSQDESLVLRHADDESPVTLYIQPGKEDMQALRERVRTGKSTDSETPFTPILTSQPMRASILEIDGQYFEVTPPMLKNPEFTEKSVYVRKINPTEVESDETLMQSVRPMADFLSAQSKKNYQKISSGSSK
jgi:hypothetical protein